MEWLKNHHAMRSETTEVRSEYESGGREEEIRRVCVRKKRPARATRGCVGVKKRGVAAREERCTDNLEKLDAGEL